MAKILNGKIVGLKMNKTAVVRIEENKIHPLYKKILKRNKKLKAHYENVAVKLGDIVKIQEVKPISKTKNWIVLKK